MKFNCIILGVCDIFVIVFNDVSVVIGECKGLVILSEVENIII